jgi:hypothetical protein
MAWGLTSELLGSHPDRVGVFGCLAARDCNRTLVKLEDARRETTNDLIGQLHCGSVAGLGMPACMCALRGRSVCCVACARPSAVVSSEQPTLSVGKSSQHGNRRACPSSRCRGAWQWQAFSRAWARQAGLTRRFPINVQQHVCLDR